MAPVDPTSISPYLLQFLLGQAPKEEQTTAGLLPEMVSPNRFSGVETDKSGNYRLLNGAATAIQNKRADSDATHAMRLQRMAQQKAEAEAAKRNAALLKKIKALQAKEKNKTPAAPPNPYIPGGSPGSTYIPKPPPNKPPTNILPVIKPGVGDGKGPGSDNSTSPPSTNFVSPEGVVKDDCPTWKKVLGLCR